MKKFGVVWMLLLGAALLSGCAGADTGSSEAIEKDKSISMQDIDWSVEEGIVDGERSALLRFTNNTAYTIAGMEIAFTQKADVTDEQKTEFLDDLKEKFDFFTEEEIAELEQREISMHAQSDRIVKPEQSAENINLYYYSGFYYMRDIAHYEFVEPDIATIRYIKDGMIYTVYYDFRSDKYTQDTEATAAQQWSTTALGDKIPRLEAEVIEASLDDEAYFSFTGYGISPDEFNAYVEACKEMGYTVNATSLDYFYHAGDEEGYTIDLAYQGDDGSLNGNISKPEETTNQ